MYQLRYFSVLAEVKNFSLAAQKLHIAQPPLSRAIKELESELGVKLFIRSTRKTTLTRAGAVLRMYADRILCTLDAAKKAAIAAGKGAIGELRVAISDLIDANRFSNLLVMIREEIRALKIQLFEVDHAHLRMGLQRDLFDVGIMKSRIRDQGIHCKLLWRDNYAVLLPQRHPLQSFATVPISEVVRYPQIVLASSRFEGLRHQVESCLASTGQKPPDIEHVQSVCMMMALVQAGFGVSLISSKMCQPHTKEDMVCRPVSQTSHTIDTYICLQMKKQESHVLEFIAQAEKLA